MLSCIYLFIRSLTDPIQIPLSCQLAVLSIGAGLNLKKYFSQNATKIEDFLVKGYINLWWDHSIPPDPTDRDASRWATLVDWIWTICSPPVAERVFFLTTAEPHGNYVMVRALRKINNWTERKEKWSGFICNIFGILNVLLFNSDVNVNNFMQLSSFGPLSF